jgi:pyruvate/2-oxoglutarate dehydrogenase complex dihydrolipoamide dehydrogenase (E3) component
VVTAWDILENGAQTGNNVVVYDDDGHVEGCGIAELLASEGKKVEILTKLLHVAPRTDAMELGHLYTRCKTKGVKFTATTIIKEIKEKSVVVSDVWSGVEQVLDNVDTVVLVTDGRKVPEDKLYLELQDTGREVYAIGDCVAPGKSDMAILEGHMVARRI